MIYTIVYKLRRRSSDGKGTSTAKGTIDVTDFEEMAEEIKRWLDNGATCEIIQITKL